MNVTMTSRTNAVRARHHGLAERLARRLAEYMNRILSVEWVVEGEGSRCMAVCRVHTARRDYRARATREGPARAMRSVYRKLLRQHQRTKSLVRKRRHLEPAETLQTPAREEMSAPVLAAVSFDASADVVLRQADARARALGAPLVVCHVLAPELGHDPFFPQYQGFRALGAMRRERETYLWLTERVERVTGRDRAGYTLVHPVGNVASGILGLAARVEPALIVMGPGLPALLVASYEKCSLLVARSGPEGCVVGASDLRDPRMPVLSAAMREASDWQRPLCFFHSVLPPLEEVPPFIGDLAPLMGPREHLSAMERARVEFPAREMLRECASRLEAPAEVRTALGLPAEELLKVARELQAGLLVVGLRHRSRLARWMCRSVVDDVAIAPPCSVLVVHPSAA